MLSKVLLALGALFAAVSGQVTDCSSGKGVFTINSQDFAPNPPVVGQNATLWIDYTVPDGVQVDAGSAKYSISLNGIPFPATTEDLCTQIECPQVPGTYNITSTDMWDGGVSGKIVSKIEWFDTNKNLLLCSQTTMRVTEPESRSFLRLRGNRVQTFILDSDSSSDGTCPVTRIVAGPFLSNRTAPGTLAAGNETRS